MDFEHDAISAVRGTHGDIEVAVRECKEGAGKLDQIGRSFFVNIECLLFSFNQFPMVKKSVS